MTDGNRELEILARLLRIGAHTGRQIACVRGDDEEKIVSLAARAEQIARELDALVRVTLRNPSKVH